MSESEATIMCHLVGGPFDGQTLEENSRTREVALQDSTDDMPLWAIYRRSNPDVWLSDDRIEFLYVGMKDRPF